MQPNSSFFFLSDGGVALRLFGGGVVDRDCSVEDCTLYLRSREDIARHQHRRDCTRISLMIRTFSGSVATAGCAKRSVILCVEKPRVDKGLLYHTKDLK